jgi:hypothetical protein
MSERIGALRVSGFVFAILLAATAKAQFTPPPCTGAVFNDVDCTGLFDAWIEQYAADEITGGCGGGNYCPNNPVTRGQMAVFVEKAMRGTAQWGPGDRGDGNTVLGNSAWLAEGGIHNTAIGAVALGNNTGHSNTSVGFGSLTANEDGFLNTAVGYLAGDRSDTIPGYGGSNVTLVKSSTGNYNTFIGYAGATAQVSNCTAVGTDAYCDATDQVRLGNFFVNSIGGKVDWSVISDARAKEDVQELANGLPLVLALRPVTYRYKSGNGRQNMGFVAQDVEELIGTGYNVVDLGGDADRTLSLRYAQLIAPLVKAIQEQQAQIEALRAEVAALKRNRE